MQNRPVRGIHAVGVAGDRHAGCGAAERRGGQRGRFVGGGPPGCSDPDYEGPVVVEENGTIQSGCDTFVGCRSDYRVLGEEQSRACDEAGFTPLNYPGDDGPFPDTPGALPETGGPAPALVVAGVLVAAAGFLARRILV